MNPLPLSTSPAPWPAPPTPAPAAPPVAASRREAEADLWLAVQDVAQLTGHTAQAIRKACADGRLITREVDGNGGAQYRIRLDSLPEIARLRYWLERLGGAPADDTPEIPPKARETALLRADLLRLYLRETENRDDVPRTLLKQHFEDRLACGVWPELLEALGPVSWKTIERWKKQYRDAGGDVMALAPAYKVKAGTEARAITRQQGEAILRYLLMGNRLKVSEVIRQARKEWAENGIVGDVSDKTIRRWIRDWKTENAATYEYMVNGAKAWNDRVAPYIIRNREAVEIGDLVVADGHTLNFEILNPATGRPKRMTLLLVLDYRTNIPLGWEIMPTEDTRCIASAYRRAILRLGFVPRVFYLDNGRAFRAKYFTGCADFEQAGINGLFDRLGSKVIHAWPYHGQSKHIERFFGTFSELERLQPSYVGTSIDNKPARLNRGESLHRELDAALSRSTAPTILEAHQLIADWCEEYIDRVQPTALRGMSPRQAAEWSLERVARSDDFEQRRITEPELRLLMMQQEVRHIGRNGITWMDGVYWHDAFATLERTRSDRFHFLYDWQDLSKIIVFDRAGQLIGIAERQSAIHPAARHLGTDADVIALESAIARRQALEANEKTKVRGLASALYPTSDAEIPAPTPKVPAAEREPAQQIDWTPILPPDEEVQQSQRIALFECERSSDDEDE